jgi:hypothetical protein
VEVVTACVGKGVYERPPDPTIVYEAFADPSGGSSDSFTLAIGHHDIAKETIVIDCVRETRPPFSPEQVTEEFARVLAHYNITEIQGDRYAGEWPREQFSKFQINYEQSAAPKSDLYRDLLPLLNSCRIELPDHPKLISQLCGLERRVARGGRDSIDHAPNGHDDIANAVAGLARKFTEFGGYDLSMKWVSGDDNDNSQQDARAWRTQQLYRALNGMIRRF